MKKLITFSIFLIITLSSLNSSAFNIQTNRPETKAPGAFTVEIIGQGKPILYLPGFATPGSIWKETVDSLHLNRKSYLFSYAGFNGTQPIDMPWYVTIKNALIEYIKQNSLTDIVIIGHSMGGNLAVDIAAELPKVVTKIIIVEALPCMREVMMPNVPAESLQYESPYNNQLLKMDDSQFKNMASRMASNMTLDEAKIETLTNWMIKADRKTWVYGYTDLLKLDLRNTLLKVKCETLILGASFPDVKKAKETYENQYANLSNKTIIMATNSKHFIMFDQPKWFNKTVSDFLVDDEK